MNQDKTNAIDFTVDSDNLYREESYTDLKIASIRYLCPIKPDGSTDDRRKPIFLGTAQLMSQAGPVPIQSLLEAKTLKEALEKFPDAMKKTLEKMIQEAEKTRHQKDSRIIVPGR